MMDFTRLSLRKATLVALLSIGAMKMGAQTRPLPSSCCGTGAEESNTAVNGVTVIIIRESPQRFFFRFVNHTGNRLAINFSIGYSRFRVDDPLVYYGAGILEPNSSGCDVHLPGADVLLKDAVRVSGSVL